MRPVDSPSSRPLLGPVLLMAVTAAWGSTFLLVKDVVAEMPAMSFLALRFALATAALVLIRPRVCREIDLATLRQGALLGAFLAGGYLFQTVGLERTSAAVSGFVTGLSVVLTPLLARPLLGHRSSASSNIAIGIATLGLAVMSLHGATVSLGVLLTLAGAGFYALQIVGLGAFASAGSTYALTVVQLGTVAAIAALGALPDGLRAPASALAWWGVVSTALVATAIAFVVQSWAQSFISPTRAAVIFTLEPAFAGLVAFLGGEHLGYRALLGGALVLAAMLLTELGPGRSSAPAPVPAGARSPGPRP